MRDDAPTPQPDVQPTPDDQLEPPAGTDWKTEARKWEARAKANAAKAQEHEQAAQRLAELEGPQQDALSRALERASAAEARVAAFESQQQLALWKTTISTETGVPAQYLRGATEDELRAHADELAPLFETRGPIVPTIGNVPTVAPRAQAEASDLARQLFRSGG